jgi:hypothetical protein
MSRKLILALFRVNKANITSAYCVYAFLKILEEMIRKRESNVLKEKGEPIKLYSD